MCFWKRGNGWFLKAETSARVMNTLSVWGQAAGLIKKSLCCQPHRPESQQNSGELWTMLILLHPQAKIFVLWGSPYPLPCWLSQIRHRESFFAPRRGWRSRAFCPGESSRSPERPNLPVWALHEENTHFWLWLLSYTDFLGFLMHLLAHLNQCIYQGAPDKAMNKYKRIWPSESNTDVRSPSKMLPHLPWVQFIWQNYKSKKVTIPMLFLKQQNCKIQA